MKNSFRYIYIFWILGLSIQLIGCANTSPTRFYVLSPATMSEKEQRPPEAPCVSIGIGPVQIPEYLGRSGIVTRVTPHEVMVGTLNRWAEPLKDNLPRVLAENLSSLLCIKSVLMLPASGASSVDYRIRMEVIRMDGKLGDTAVLDVFWTVLAGKEVLRSKRSNYRQTTGGEGYEEFVSAQSRNLASLSREIAEAILVRSK
jgi:uncharacterized lipoprotein YmbA